MSKKKKGRRKKPRFPKQKKYYSITSFEYWENRFDETNNSDEKIETIRELMNYNELDDKSLYLDFLGRTVDSAGIEGKNDNAISLIWEFKERKGELFKKISVYLYEYLIYLNFIKWNLDEIKRIIKIAKNNIIKVPKLIFQILSFFEIYSHYSLTLFFIEQIYIAFMKDSNIMKFAKDEIKHIILFNSIFTFLINNENYSEEQLQQFYKHIRQYIKPKKGEFVKTVRVIEGKDSFNWGTGQFSIEQPNYQDNLHWLFVEFIAYAKSRNIDYGFSNNLKNEITNFVILQLNMFENIENALYVSVDYLEKFLVLKLNPLFGDCHAGTILAIGFPIYIDFLESKKLIVFDKTELMNKLPKLKRSIINLIGDNYWKYKVLDEFLDKNMKN